MEKAVLPETDCHGPDMSVKLINARLRIKTTPCLPDIANCWLLHRADSLARRTMAFFVVVQKHDGANVS